MKIIKLSDDDHTLLKAAFDACLTDELALDKAHKAKKLSQATYNDLCAYLCKKHKIEKCEASDDQVYLIDRFSTSPEEPKEG